MFHLTFANVSQSLVESVRAGRRSVEHQADVPRLLWDNRPVLRDGCLASSSGFRQSTKDMTCGPEFAVVQSSMAP